MMCALYRSFPPLVFLVAGLLAGCGTAAQRSLPAVESGLELADAAAKTAAVDGDFAQLDAVASLVDRLVGSGDYRRDELSRILAQVEYQPWIIDLMDRQATPAKATGSTGAWTGYRARFVTQDNITKGTDFWRRYHEAFERAYTRFGVPPEYIAAIIGIETRYGGYMGSTRIIDALATLAFDYPRRSEYFTRELESFLIMCRYEGVDPLTPRGSYAGAMGLGQFMPTSFHGYAVDFDGNGQRDLWNPTDVIGSIANYLSGHGWRRDAGVAIPAEVKGYAPRSMEAGFDARYPVAFLADRGIQPVYELPAQKEVSLIELDGARGWEYWVGLDNFQVIAEYNRSTYYAMSVHQLAQALGQARNANASLAQRDR